MYLLIGSVAGPKGWSSDRTDKIARLRVFKRNGGNIFDLVVKKKESVMKKVIANGYSKKILGRTMKKEANRDYSRITILDTGKRTSMYMALKALRGVV
jgi:hypothetical protein